MTAVHEMTLLIYRITDEFPERERDVLGNHMRRAALEAAAGRPDALTELRSLIELARELDHIGPRVADALHAALAQLSTLDAQPVNQRSNP